MFDGIIMKVAGVAATKYINEKLKDSGMEGILVKDVDIKNGKISLQLDGEVDDVSVSVERLEYRLENDEILITNVHVRVESDASRKVWMESILNMMAEKYIEAKGCIVINMHADKIEKILKSAKYATMA